MVENKAGIYPIGRMVLVLLDPVPTHHGSIAIPESVQERDKLAQVRATLIACGGTAWKEEDSPKEAVPVGSRVSIRRYAGEYMIGKDEVPYRIINDKDVFATLDNDVPTQTN